MWSGHEDIDCDLASLQPNLSNQVLSERFIWDISVRCGLIGIDSERNHARGREY